MNKNIVVVDCDGTIALDEHREHFLKQEPKDWDSYFKAAEFDEPNYPVIRMVQLLHEAGYRIIIATGRIDDIADKTVEWLNKYGIPFDELIMRQSDDREDDDKLKQSWIDNGLIPKDEIFFVFEDRKRVVKMWRENGITCLQPREADF